ncbi:hypothetical protein AAFJ72_14455 [Brevibacillus gelatini]
MKTFIKGIMAFSMLFGLVATYSNPEVIQLPTKIVIQYGHQWGT